MRIFFTLLLLTVGTLYADDSNLFIRPPAPSQQAPTKTVPGRALWLTSLSTLAVANGLDIHSSWGKRELNGLLAGPDQTFGARGTMLKLGFQGGLVGLQYLLMRGHCSGKLYRTLSWMNFGAAAGISSVAVHNYTIPRLRR